MTAQKLLPPTSASGSNEGHYLVLAEVSGVNQ